MHVKATDVNAPVNFEIIKVPTIGAIPVPKLNTTLRLKLLVLSIQVKAAHIYEKLFAGKEPTWPTHDPEYVHKIATEMFGRYLPDTFNSSHIPNYNGDQNFYDYITVKGCYYIEKLDNDLYNCNVRFLTEVPVKKNSPVNGGEVILSFRDRKVLYIIDANQQKVYPNDPLWEYEKWRMRNSIFVNISFTWHLGWVHYKLSGKVYIALHTIIKDKHPLKMLLKPFCHDSDKVILRSNAFIFAEGGKINRIDYRDGNEAIKMHVNRYKLKEYSEYNFDSQLDDIVRPIWEAIYEFVNEFVIEFEISKDDPGVNDFVRYLSKETDVYFEEKELVVTLSSYIFTATAIHYIVGHLYNGNSDISYISNMTFKPTSADDMLNPKWVDICETIPETMTRAAIITSIGRPSINLLNDFSISTEDEKAKQIFTSFYNNLKKLETCDPEQILKKLPVAPMV